ncbi:hypothetical protein SO694_00011176 [Aureococcus anophagefferens]|uniref:Uncharacterized protein n=1 Tax=Aureococcus anophagefferens TaxID=44056 RepID=A0ABR1GEM7_AURAN
MPWVLDDDVALRERERRLDDAYHTRRWPYTDGRRRRFADGDDDAYGTATDDDDDALLHRGYGLPRQSGDVVVENHVRYECGGRHVSAGTRARVGRLRRGAAPQFAGAVPRRRRGLRPAGPRALPRRDRALGRCPAPLAYGSRTDGYYLAKPHAADFSSTATPSRPTTSRRGAARRPTATAPPARSRLRYDVGRAPSYAARASYADWAGSGFAAGVPAYASDLRF